MSEGDASKPPGGLEHPKSSRALFAFFLSLAVGLLVVLGHYPPDAVPASAPPEVFSAERAFHQLERVLEPQEPHPLGTPANARVRERIVTQLSAIGLLPEVSDNWVSSSHRWSTSVARPRNVIAEIPSRQPDLPAIVLACHYDSVPAGPGASDDGAAIGAFLEIARILMAEAPLARPVILLFTDGEESGLYGARAFAVYNSIAERVGIILNFEARGSSGPSLMFETSENNRWIIEQATRGLRRPVTSSAYVEVYRIMTNSSDLTVFLRRGLAGMNFAFIDGPKHYHSPLDNLANLDPRSLQHHGEHALGMVRQLLKADWTEASSDRGDAVHTDLFGRWIISWPASWTPWSGGLLLVLFGALFGVLRAHHGWSISQISHAVSGWFLILIVGATGGWLSAWLLLQIDGTPSRWPDRMHYDVAVACLGAVVGVLLMTMVSRPHPTVLLLVHGLVCAAASTILGLTYPGFSYLFILPAAAALVVSPLLLIRSRHAGGLFWVCLATGAVTAALVAPILVRLPSSLGIIFAAPVVSTLTALALLPLVPLIGTMPRLRFIPPITVAAIAATACFVLALRSPPFTTNAPQQINLTHLEVSDSQSAHLILNTWEGELPAHLLEGLTPAEDLTPIYPLPGKAVETVAAGLPAPEAELVAWDAESEEQTARVRFAPTRLSQQILVGVPDGQNLTGITVLGSPLDVPPETWGGHRWLRLRGLPADGLEIELSWRGKPTLPLSLVGITPGLPPSAGAVAAERDELPACPAHTGDESVVISRITLASPVF